MRALTVAPEPCTKLTARRQPSVQPLRSRRCALTTRRQIRGAALPAPGSHCKKRRNRSGTDDIHKRTDRRAKRWSTSRAANPPASIASCSRRGRSFAPDPPASSHFLRHPCFVSIGEQPGRDMRPLRLLLESSATAATAGAQPPGPCYRQLPSDWHTLPF